MRTFILFLIALVFSLGNEAWAATGAPEKIGVIGAANPAVQKAGQATKLGDVLHFNDSITTDENGNAQLLFLDKSALTVGPNSSLTIDNFVYNPADKSGNLAVSGTKGVFRFIGGALSKKEPVLLKTPVSTIGIRGGIAVVEIDAKGATNATFVYGHEMTVTNLKGEVQSTTTPGFAINVLDGFTPPSAPVKLDMGTLAEKLGKLATQKGTNGGAAVVPDAKAVKENLRTSEPAPAQDSGTDAAPQTDSRAQDSDNTSAESDAAETPVEPKDSTENTKEPQPAPSTKKEDDAPKPVTNATAPATTSGNAPAPGAAPTPQPQGTSYTTAPVNNPAPTTTTTATAPLPPLSPITTASAPQVFTDVTAQVSCARDGRGFDCTGRHYLTGTFFDSRGFDKGGRHQNGTFFDGRGFNLSGMHKNGTPYDAAGLDVNGVPRPIDTSSSSSGTTGSSSGTTTSSGGTTTSSGGTTTSSGGTTTSSGGTTTSSGGTTTSSGGTTTSSGGTTTTNPNAYANYRPGTGANYAIYNLGSPFASTNLSTIVLSSGLNQVHNLGAARCTTCAFADWGVWQASLGSANMVPGATVNPANLDLVVVGQVTQNLGTLTNLGTVNYTGVTVGHNAPISGTKNFTTGTFTSTVDIANRALTDFDGTFSGFRFGFTGQNYQFASAGPAASGPIPVQNLGGITITTGSISPALFGPNAENMGGGFTLQGTAENAAGVFVGTR